MIGISLGLLAGDLGGWIDAVVNRLTEYEQPRTAANGRGRSRPR